MTDKVQQKGQEVRQPRNITNVGEWIKKEVKNIKHVYSQHGLGHDPLTTFKFHKDN